MSGPQRRGWLTTLIAVIALTACTSSPPPTTSEGAPTESRVPAPTPTPVSDSSPLVDLAGTFPGGLWAIRGRDLLTSVDVGSTWAARGFPPQKTVLTASALDATHAWVVSAGPGSTDFTGDVTDVLSLVVATTTDGGATWTEHPVQGSYPGTTQVIAFVDASHGFLLCASERQSLITSTVLRSDDGGTTWELAGRYHGLGSEFAAVDGQTLLAGAQQEAGPVEHPLFAVSHDAGSTWADAGLPGLAGALGGAMRWLPAPPTLGSVTASAVGVSGADGRTRTFVFRTDDRASHWARVSVIPAEPSAGLAVLDDRHWLLPVQNPLGLLATDDGGSTWTSIGAAIPNGGWFDWISAIDSTHVAALGPTESSSLGPLALYLSSDAGRTWSPAAFNR
jgi:photosystem II stability/assembly factor-like uncharacterized protein